MKKKLIKSAIPIYGCAAVWLVLGLLCPGMLLKGWFLLVVAALSAAVYFVLSKIFRGREVEIRESAKSGDKSIDVLIDEGRRRLDSLKDANAAIDNANISDKLERMVTAGEEIFRILERNTAHAHEIRRFMNYYLPTAEKLMKSYCAMMETDGAGKYINSSMRSIENSLSLIADAFEKQMDNLYRDHAMDIETDIEVLETMMAGDGLTANGIAEE